MCFLRYQKGNQHIVDYLFDYLFKLVKREKLATLHFNGFASFQITGDERIELRRNSNFSPSSACKPA